MKDIDIEVKVTPLQHSLSDPRGRAIVLKHSARQGAFDPPVNPEIRGRRPSGAVFKAADVPKAARGTPIVEEPIECRNEYRISKRSAKSVAEELTERPVQVRQNATGRCEIEVIFPVERLVFEGNTWFYALQSLNSWLTQRKSRR